MALAGPHAVTRNASSGALTIPVATERGRDLLASMQRGEAPKRPALPGEGAESATKRQKVLAEAAAGAAGVPVTTVATGRSRSAIEHDSNRIMDASADPRFADADIWQTAPDTGRVVVAVSNRTAGLELAKGRNPEGPPLLALSRNGQFHLLRILDQGTTARRS